MNSSNKMKPIVVAVDGSESALRAVRWAAREAAQRERQLRIVHTYEWPMPHYGPLMSELDNLNEIVRNGAATVIRAAVAAAGEAAPGLPVVSETLRGRVVPVLRTVSEQASLLVLGSRGLGGFTGLLAGSAAVALAAHGHCPVAVVRGGDPDPQAPVVVGVDGSPASSAAVEFAFEEASARGCGLVAVHVWTDAAFPYAPEPGVTVGLDWAPLVEAAHETLAERLTGWPEKYPEVHVQRVVKHDRPAHALLEAAEDAQLVVVGSRGRGGFTGLTLGSVSQAMIHHAPCPVVIARPGTAE